MLQGSLDWTCGTKGQFIRPKCIGAARSRTCDILILISSSAKGAVTSQHSICLHDLVLQQRGNFTIKCETIIKELKQSQQMNGVKWNFLTLNTFKTHVLQNKSHVRYIHMLLA